MRSLLDEAKEQIEGMISENIVLQIDDKARKKENQGLIDYVHDVQFKMPLTKEEKREAVGHALKNQNAKVIAFFKNGPCDANYKFLVDCLREIEKSPLNIDSIHEMLKTHMSKLDQSTNLTAEDVTKIKKANIFLAAARKSGTDIDVREAELKKVLESAATEITERLVNALDVNDTELMNELKTIRKSLSQPSTSSPSKTTLGRTQSSLKDDDPALQTSSSSPSKTILGRTQSSLKDDPALQASSSSSPKKAIGRLASGISDAISDVKQSVSDATKRMKEIVAKDRTEYEEKHAEQRQEKPELTDVEKEDAAIKEFRSNIS